MNDSKVEPVLVLLACCMVFFTAVLVGVEYFFKEDAQVFQVIASILTGVVGAFLGRIKPAKGDTGAAGSDASGASITVASSVTKKEASPAPVVVTPATE